MIPNPAALAAHARLASVLQSRVHRAWPEVLTPPNKGVALKSACCKECGTTDAWAFERNRKTHCKRCRSARIVELTMRRRQKGE